MPITCRHKNNYYANHPFQPDLTPNAEEINKHRLYQCSRCKGWISLTGDVRSK